MRGLAKLSRPALGSTKRWARLNRRNGRNASNSGSCEKRRSKSSKMLSALKNDRDVSRLGETGPSATAGNPLKNPLRRKSDSQNRDLVCFSSAGESSRTCTCHVQAKKTSPFIAPRSFQQVFTPKLPRFHTRNALGRFDQCKFVCSTFADYLLRHVRRHPNLIANRAGR